MGWTESRRFVFRISRGQSIEDLKIYDVVVSYMKKMREEIYLLIALGFSCIQMVLIMAIIHI